MFLKQFHIIEREGTFQVDSVRSTLFWSQKPTEQNKEEILPNVFECKIMQNSSKFKLTGVPQIAQQVSFQRCKDVFIFYKSISINRMRDKNRIIIPIDGEETLAKTQHPFMVCTR